MKTKSNLTISSPGASAGLNVMPAPLTPGLLTQLTIRKIKVSSKFFSQLALVVLCLASVMNSACADQRILKANKNTAPVSTENTKTSFESDLETMKTANFEFIFVIRRKDGGAFDSEDRKFLISNKPAQINRFILTDEEKAFIAGSKYQFPEENLKNIKTRFNVEDFSAVKAQEPGNSNQESEKEKSNAAK